MLKVKDRGKEMHFYHLIFISKKVKKDACAIYGDDAIAESILFVSSSLSSDVERMFLQSMTKLKC